MNENARPSAPTNNGGRVPLDAIVRCLTPVGETNSSAWTVPVDLGPQGTAYVGPFPTRDAAERWLDRYFPAVSGVTARPWIVDFEGMAETFAVGHPAEERRLDFIANLSEADRDRILSDVINDDDLCAAYCTAITEAFADAGYDFIGEDDR